MRLDGGAMFGNAPKALWMRWMVPDEQNRIDLAARALLLQTSKGENILFEAGIGCFFEPKLKERFGVTSAEHVLLQNLAKMGMQPADIDAVILSHLHFDHAGGLLTPYDEGPPALVFPRAKFYVARRHWEWALHPHPRERASFIPQLHKLLETSGRLVLIDGPNFQRLPWPISFYSSNGHTIGLMVSVIETDSGPLAFVSDVIPGVPWLNLSLAMGYDRFPEQLIDEKTALLEALSNKKGSVFFTHDPATVCMNICKDGSGRYAGESFSL
jgi:glyoxylase-like metal-dependent hydrolase (beta-lactamase superfamily II)